MIGTGATVSGPRELDRRFRELRQQIQASDDAVMQANAEEMASTAEAAAQKVTGKLKATVRVITKEKNGRKYFLVVAGGRGTRRDVKTGKRKFFDYARANEFGTQNAAAEPFFFPTYRRLKRRFRSRISAARLRIIRAFKL